MTKAILIHENGGPEVLKWEDYDPGKPQEGEALVRHEAIGLNFIDVYHRTGLYPLPGMPAVIGSEGAGIVEEIGQGVTEVAVGDRVVYGGGPPGAYAEVRRIPAQRLVKLPDGITAQQGAAMMLQGLTAWYLLRRTYQLKAGETILFQAAAGGVGLIACQWASHLGATVIGTVGSPQKAELAKSHGCHHTILYNEEDFEEKVKEITAGKGVDVVFDAVGQATFMKSLDCLRPMGWMVSFGQSSGKVAPLDVNMLTAKGSLYLTRPSLAHYTARREDLVAGAKELFSVVEQGAVKIEVCQTYPLSEAAQAHKDLEGRKTTGSTILSPG